MTITRAGKPVAELSPVAAPPLSASVLLARWRHPPGVDPDRLRRDIDATLDSRRVLPQDVLRLGGCATGINIKLTNGGGLNAALEMITLSRGVGLRIMLGCKNESALGVAATAQLGARADYLDLDGHLNLLDDPFTGTVVDHATITLPGGHGLGAAAIDPGFGED